MLWQTIVNKVIKEVYTNPDVPASRIVFKSASLEKQTAKDWVSSIDAHHAETLRQLAWWAFPKKLRTGELIADQNIHGAWRITTKTVT